MTEQVTDRLVEEVARRVLAALGQASPPAAGGDVAADVPPTAPAGQPEPAAPAPSGRVWVTVEMLAGRVDGSEPVCLAMNEYLTPAARDHARARGIEVVRGNSRPASGPVTLPAPGRVRPAVLTRTLGLVANRPDAKVESALAGAARAGVVIRDFGESSSWMVNAQSMCRALGAGELAGGVIVDRYAAAAIVLAAKLPGARPVQGVSPAAVEAALRQFDANVLVIGHRTVSLYEIRTMIDRFAAGRRSGRDRTALLDFIEQLNSSRRGPEAGGGTGPG